ncbi:MAG TPA: asparagine synthase (glutamine-hydrolyzing) [Blastocatellia bacterium]
MCGICGIAIPESVDQPVDEPSLIRMCDSLTHRGPDDAGVFIDGRVGLGHRRLSIVDLAGGHQPMSNEDGNVWITYNGEVYNHRDLRPWLEEQGHVYQNNSDTETIIHLYEEQGPRAVEQLRGMFAFAIWDKPRRRLVLARDRLGIKPLYYTLSDDGVICFASEIKALMEARAVRAELNYDALADYAANRATSGEETLFRGVKRLAPGHTLVWTDGKVHTERYWDVSFAKPDQPASESQYIEQFSELFSQSVRLRLMADVPLGVFLSGGIDSSAIVAAMSEMVSDPVKTFSVAFDEREANELEYARMVAQAFGTDHHEVIVTPQEFFDALPSLVYQEDEPIAHPSSVPLYFVSKLASRHVKVVLTGEGSDELLAGYDKYRKTVYNLALGRAYHGALPGPLRRAIAQAILSHNGKGSSQLRQKLSRTFLCLWPEIEEIYFDNFSVFSRAMQRRLFTAGALDRMTETDPYSAPLELIGDTDSPALLDQLLAADLRTYLHELLMKQDQMSMAASIESRVPFLDHKLVEFACALPVNMKLRGLTTKYILRKAMQRSLPNEILTRRKMGFPVPIGAWLRGPFRHVVDEYVLGSRAKERGIFNPEFVNEIVARYYSGENHSERLWALINFEIWQRRFFDGEPAPAGQCRAAQHGENWPVYGSAAQVV